MKQRNWESEGKRGYKQEWQILSLSLVSPWSWATKPMKALQLLASPLAVPFLLLVALLCSAEPSFTLSSFFVSAQHMSPYSLFWSLYSPLEGWTCSEESPAGNTSFESLKWHQPPGKFAVMVLAAFSYWHLQGFRLFFVLPNPPCLTMEPWPMEINHSFRNLFKYCYKTGHGSQWEALFV